MEDIMISLPFYASNPHMRRRDKSLPPPIFKTPIMKIPSI
jgi:hypothetical protein